MRIIVSSALLLLLGACASGSDEQSSERSKGIQVSAGTSSQTIQCPGRHSECYARVREMCGDRGVREVATMGSGQVQTAGRNGDDPFARVDGSRMNSRTVSLKCRDPKPGSE